MPAPQSGHEDKCHYPSGNHSPWAPRRPVFPGRMGASSRSCMEKGTWCQGSPVQGPYCHLDLVGQQQVSQSPSLIQKQGRTTPPPPPAELLKEPSSVAGRMYAAQHLARSVREVNIRAPAWGQTRAREPWLGACPSRKLLLKQEVAYFSDNLHFIPSTSCLQFLMTLFTE